MRNFYEHFAATEEKFGTRPAVEVQRRDGVDCFTYTELRRMAHRAAAWLAAHGIGPGDHCALLADNDAHWCAAYLGVLRLGAGAVPLDTAYSPKQIAALLRDSGAKIVFTTPRYLAGAQEAALGAGAVSEIVLLHGAASGVASYEEILTGPALAELPPCPATPPDPAVMLYTSGTTSDPKGVVLTHANLLAEIDGVLRVVPVDERDRVLGVLPLFHALAQMANLLVPFFAGACVVFLESVNTTELLRALAQRETTIFACVPQFFYLIHQRLGKEVAAAAWPKRAAFRTLLRANGALRERLGINLGRFLFRRVHDVLGRRMRLLITGGSRFDPGIGRDLYRLGFDILQGYGLTECCGAATLTAPGDPAISSVGPPLPGVEIRILPPEVTAAAEAADGEVAIRGPIVMQGYYNRPDATAAALQDGWLHTGDLGYRDARGRLYISGRKKEVIVLSSGKNIYPEEIEAHYLQSPYIKELCVLGRARADEPAAERLHAVVVPDFEVMRERKVVNTREILRYEIENLSIQLPSHKRVLSYELWTEALPRTTTRKLKRFEIEQRVRERGAGEEAAAAARPLSEEEAAWAADPVVARALDIIREAAKQAGPVRSQANIELDLGLDSMERVELLTQLEQAFGSDVPEEAASRIYTVRELVEAVRPGGAVAVAEAGPGRNTWAQLLQAPLADDPFLAELTKPKPLLIPFLFALMKLYYFLARLLFRFQVSGREHLPAAGPFLLCPNHQSYIDPFFVVSALPYRLFRQVFFVGASEYFATPVMRWLARLMNLVPVDPDTNLLRAMQAGAFGLRQGKVLILFPEGERSIDGQPKKFKKGASILSQHLQVPIVPVALDGVYDVWPRGAGFPQRLARVSLRFGAAQPPLPPLPMAASLAEAEAHYAAVAEQLRNSVLEMWNGLHRPSPA